MYFIKKTMYFFSSRALNQTLKIMWQATTELIRISKTGSSKNSITY